MRNRSGTERRAIAAPGAIPLLGHTLSMIRDPLAFMTSLGDHGDLVRRRQPAAGIEHEHGIND